MFLRQAYAIRHSLLLFQYGALVLDLGWDGSFMFESFFVHFLISLSDIYVGQIRYMTLHHVINIALCIYLNIWIGGWRVARRVFL